MADAVPKYFRRVLRITAWDSPNCRLAQEELRQGKPVSNTVIVPGVLTWQELQQRLATWDPIRICVGCSAQFYEGPGILLFPPKWMERAHQIAEALRVSGVARQAEAIGCDPAEGGDGSSWSVVDRKGLIHQETMKTPDTTLVVSHTIFLIREYRVPPEKVMFDPGGGGKEHVDRLRKMGFNVGTVAFGESVTPPPKRRGTGGTQATKVVEREERYQYVNRRAQLAHIPSLLLDPKNEGFGIPREYTELARQMSLMPKLYDAEGRLRMLPKNRKNESSKQGEKTLVELIGHSPDEFDSFILAVYSLTSKVSRATAGAAT